MARKGLIEKNNRRQKMASKYKNRRQKLLSIARNRALSAEERFSASMSLAALPRNSAPTRLCRRCALTGRVRGVYRRFGLSRIKLRELASIGQIPGMTRSSW